MHITKHAKQHNEHSCLNAPGIPRARSHLSPGAHGVPRTSVLSIQPTPAFSGASSSDRLLMGIVADQKITDLFLRRGLWHYAQRLLSPRLFDQWAEMAFDVQRRIYDLDDHYETTVTLGCEDELCLWNSLADAAALVSSTGTEALQRAIRDLRGYANDEARIHAGVGFDREEWLVITYRKSADVSLARELAFDLMKRRAPSVSVRTFLRLYDQVMEVLEDLDDLHEDCYDWNLNFWLTPIRQGVAPAIAVSDMYSVINDLCRQAQSAWDGLHAGEQHAHLASWDDLLEQVSSCLAQRKKNLSYLSRIEYVPYDSLRQR